MKLAFPKCKIMLFCIKFAIFWEKVKSLVLDLVAHVKEILLLSIMELFCVK